jgi:hypothetical protein
MAKQKPKVPDSVRVYWEVSKVGGSGWSNRQVYYLTHDEQIAQRLLDAVHAEGHRSAKISELWLVAGEYVVLKTPYSHSYSHAREIQGVKQDCYTFAHPLPVTCANGTKGCHVDHTQKTLASMRHELINKIRAMSLEDLHSLADSVPKPDSVKLEEPT